MGTRNRPREKIISLFGTWKFSRALGLKDQRNQPLGLNVTFTHKFLKRHDAETFIRLEKLLGKEDRAEVGVRVPF